jgi:cardiolipin synthase
MGLSDALDGFLARCYDWKTTLGAYLDPIADKVMLLSAYLTFAILGWVPWWLSGLVIARDVVLLVGAVCYHLSTRQLKMDPLAISKVNTFAQIILAVSLIYAQVGPMSAQVISGLIAVVACTTLASGSQYVIEWLRRAAKVSASRAKL